MPLASSKSDTAATEYLRFRGGDYLAAYDDYNQSIDFLQLIQPTAAVDSFNIICPTNVGVPPARPGTISEVALTLGGSVPAREGARLRLALPRAMHVDLAIYDVQGRRIRGLLNGPLPAGTMAAFWDGRDRDGRSVGTGVYFARLLCPGTQRVARIPLIR